MAGMMTPGELQGWEPRQESSGVAESAVPSPPESQEAVQVLEYAKNRYLVAFLLRDMFMSKEEESALHYRILEELRSMHWETLSDEQVQDVQIEAVYEAGRRLKEVVAAWGDGPRFTSPRHIYGEAVEWYLENLENGQFIDEVEEEEIDEISLLGATSWHIPGITEDLCKLLVDAAKEEARARSLRGEKCSKWADQLAEMELRIIKCNQFGCRKPARWVDPNHWTTDARCQKHRGKYEWLCTRGALCLWADVAPHAYPQAPLELPRSRDGLTTKSVREYLKFRFHAVET